MSEKSPIICLNPHDNVAVTLKDLTSGAQVGTSGTELLIREKIPAGHKVAIRKIEPRTPVIKYGEVIGFASQTIEPGKHVHSHNIEILDYKRDISTRLEAQSAKSSDKDAPAVFDGIVRSNGQVGTRNFIGVMATVSCAASVSQFIAESFSKGILAEFPNVDGIISLSHDAGCGMSPDAEGFSLLQRSMAGYARHPNFGGLLFVGLGCEVNQIGCLLENMGLKSNGFLRTLSIQTTGGTPKTVQRGVDLIREMLPEVNRYCRRLVPADHIMLGLECGGSDAYSGISANPALGHAADLVIREGGTAILSETPEIYGAEHLLTRRAVSDEVRKKLLQRIDWWKEYVARSGGGGLSDKITPGNRAGGLTNIIEKSLGAVVKGGSTSLMEVYEYAQPVTTKGLVFMDTPGYDPVSITGMVAGGANIVCFTTGRGTVCGFKPVPTIKLASNTEMYHRLESDMDLNCGRILDGDATIEETGKAIFSMILKTASGQKTQSEKFGFGANEFIPWQIGPII